MPALYACAARPIAGGSEYFWRRHVNAEHRHSSRGHWHHFRRCHIDGAEGKLVEQRRLQTNVFKPAYIKDKRAPDLRKPIRRMIGERLGGSMSGAEREMANLEFERTFRRACRSRLACARARLYSTERSDIVQSCAPRIAP
jgi:hypothetical protein